MPTLSQSADRALANLQAYQVAHLNMAAAAERVVDMVAEHVFTPAEAIESLAMFTAQYRAKLASLDGQAASAAAAKVPS